MRPMTECEYRINAELKKEVEAFVEVLAKKYDLRLLSIETACLQHLKFLVSDLGAS